METHKIQNHWNIKRLRPRNATCLKHTFGRLQSLKTSTWDWSCIVRDDNFTVLMKLGARADSSCLRAVTWCLCSPWRTLATSCMLAILRLSIDIFCILHWSLLLLLWTWIYRYEVVCFVVLGCSAVWTAKRIASFRRRCTVIFISQDGCSKHVWNVGLCVP